LRRGAGAVTIAAPEIGERRDHRSLIVLEAAQPPDALRLKIEPTADCGRYDSIRKIA
jgi:hypothetical protein